jgi:hypothetical protein
MKIVQGDEQPIVYGRNTRAGQLNKQYIITGDDDSPGNFVFGLYHQAGEFYAPRHRHNFDQWRYQVEGDIGFDRNRMSPGILGYFPEGSYYGPNTGSTTPEGPNTVVLCQFGGPGGNGYPSQDQVYKAYEAMKEFGHFEQGVYHRNEGVPGKKAMDSFQATWEFLNKRPMVYPQPQYSGQILMDTRNYRWMPLEGVPGVEEKAYGTFTDCKIRGASYKLDPGATFEATGRGIYMVLSGRGVLAGQPYRQWTACYLETGESTTYRADETTEVLLFGLPEIVRMRTPLPHDIDAVEEEELAVSG